MQYAIFGILAIHAESWPLGDHFSGHAGWILEFWNHDRGFWMHLSLILAPSLQFLPILMISFSKNSCLPRWHIQLSEDAFVDQDSQHHYACIPAIHGPILPIWGLHHGLGWPSITSLGLTYTHAQYQVDK
jgi:hypothetical protein